MINIIGINGTFKPNASDDATKDYGDDLIAYLKSPNVNKIVYVFATHLEAEHVSGLIDIVNTFTFV